MFIEVGFIFLLSANVLKIFSLWLLFAHSLTWRLHSQMFSLSFFVCSPQKAGYGACICFFCSKAFSVFVCMGVCERVGALFMYLLYFHTLELVHPSNCTLNDNEVYLFVVFLFFFFFQSSSSASRWQSSTTSSWSMCRRCYRWRFTFPFSISLYPILHVSLKFMQDVGLSVCLFAMFIYLFILYILIFFYYVK